MEIIQGTMMKLPTDKKVKQASLKPRDSSICITEIVSFERHNVPLASSQLG